MKLKRNSLTALLLLVSLMQMNSQTGKVSQVALTNFLLQSSHVISESGEVLSTGAYKNDVYWMPVRVPSTVLTGLVANKVYPDPYLGFNNMLIPDASDEFNKEYKLEQYSHLPGLPNPWKKPYWYRTSFVVPAQDNGRHFDLIFKGINYRAAVWVNGKLVADSAAMAGMFAEYRLDVTDKIVAGATNWMAVKIYPLDYPGLPSKEQMKGLDDFYPNGGPTGDIGKNVTMLCSVGWDWMPPVRDRNIGIWQPVYLRTSGHVTIEKPRIITALPGLPDTLNAKLSVELTLKNAVARSEKGKLQITISPETFSGQSITVTKDVTIGNNGKLQVKLDAENTKEFNIKQPRLWWPVGYGRPDLYRIKLQYSGTAGLSDEVTFLFGIRTVATKAVEVNKTWRRDFYVNGERIHITGGAWVPDMMLNRDSIRYDYEFRLCRNSKINLVRIWGGGVTPSDLFFDAADRYGLLVWSDFWVTGDTQGEFKGSNDWPFDGNIFRKNVESTIYRIRNHPSLLLWTGGNEGHARKELYYAMRDSIIKLDGTRPFIPSSSGFAHLPEGWDGSWPDGKPSGVYSGGPYTWQDPREYYKKADFGGDWVFKDETGIPSQPTFSALPKIITNLVWDKSLPFPLNDSWGYHDAATGNGRYDLYLKEMVKRYGQPASMKEFSDKMQLMNAVGYQGIFEAAGHKLNDIGGVMLWKLNAAFPSVVWQVYDWFLIPNAGYYFMQNAIEPVHAQMNTLDLNVEYINRTYKACKGLKAEIQVFDINSTLLYSKTETFDIDGPSVKESFSLKDVLGKNKGLSFVLLKLIDAKGNQVSRNTYWHTSDGIYTALNSMPATTIDVKRKETVTLKNEKRLTLTFSNTSGKVAFFINPSLVCGEEELAPSFWSANYFSLAPGESIDVTVGYPAEKTSSSEPTVKVEGWNVSKIEIPPVK
ncbi:MAG: glycoside hydrolase family 2 TIM barrel-domain containing protein [Bacteroidales bacterium]